MNSNVLENESEKLDNLKSELDRDITPCHEEQQHSMYSLCEAFFFAFFVFALFYLIQDSETKSHSVEFLYMCLVSLSVVWVP